MNKKIMHDGGQAYLVQEQETQEIDFGKGAGRVDPLVTQSIQGFPETERIEQFTKLAELCQKLSSLDKAYNQWTLATLQKSGRLKEFLTFLLKNPKYYGGLLEDLNQTISAPVNIMKENLVDTNGYVKKMNEIYADAIKAAKNNSDEFWTILLLGKKLRPAGIIKEGIKERIKERLKERIDDRLYELFKNERDVIQAFKFCNQMFKKYFNLNNQANAPESEAVNLAPRSFVNYIKQKLQEKFSPLNKTRETRELLQKENIVFLPNLGDTMKLNTGRDDQGRVKTILQKIDKTNVPWTDANLSLKAAYKLARKTSFSNYNYLKKLYILGSAFEAGCIGTTYVFYQFPLLLNLPAMPVIQIAALMAGIIDSFLLFWFYPDLRRAKSHDQASLSCLMAKMLDAKIFEKIKDKKGNYIKTVLAKYNEDAEEVELPGLKDTEQIYNNLKKNKPYILEFNSQDKLQNVYWFQRETGKIIKVKK